MMQKAEVRELGKAARAALGDSARAGFDAQIVAACQTTLDWPRYRRVMVFLPIARQNEIDLWPLVRWIRKTHPDIEVYAPRVVGDELAAVLIAPESAFNERDWGILEPVNGKVLTAHETLDLALVPLLGFDSAGQRVGYGRGYYDRFLAGYPRVQRVGVAYECLRVDEKIAVTDHDVALSAVITEAGLENFTQAQGHAKYVPSLPRHT